MDERTSEMVIQLGKGRLNSLLLGNREPGCAGEFSIEEDLARAISGRRLGSAITAECHAAMELGLDYLACKASGEVEGRLAAILHNGLFAFALVEGGFTRLCRDYGLGETLALLSNREVEAATMIQHLLHEQLEAAHELLLRGAHGIILAEDIAYEKGLFFSDITFRRIVLSEVEEVCRVGVPVVFHSDGDISGVLASLKGTALSGVHSCERSGKMSLLMAERELGDTMALFGGLERRYLLDQAEDLVNEVIALGRASRDVRFCFGSSAGVLDDAMDSTRVRLAFDSYRSQGLRKA